MNKFDHITYPTMVLVVGCILGTTCTYFYGRASENKVVEQRRHFRWVSFLNALEDVEAPKTEKQAADAIEREQAYGPLQIRKPCLDDVNRKYGTGVTLEEVRRSRALSRWVCVHYLRMYGADKDYETAARTWVGGPEGPHRSSSLPYWSKVRAAMIGRTDETTHKTEW